MTVPFGIHSSIPAEQYHRDEVADRPSLSASLAHVLLSASPKHAWTCHPRLNPDYVVETDAKFDLGTVVHSLLLEGMSVMDIHAFPDWRTNAAKDAAEVSRAHGRIPLLSKHAHDVTQMVGAVADQLALMDIDPVPLTDGLPEQTLVWEEAGVFCRSRVDWLHNDYSVICDVKTTSRSAHPDAFSRNLYGLGYDTKAAFYIRGVKALTGITPTFRWIVVETTAPYALSVVSPGPDVLALADAKVDRALSIWKRCLATDEWDGYPTSVCWAELPAWAESQWLDREAREEMAA